MLMELGAVKVFAGSRVGWSSGYVVPYTVATGIVFLGTARADVDNSGGSAGDLKVEVDFHKPKRFVWWDNTPSANACVKANRGAAAYAESDHEVGNLSTGASSPGTIFEIGNAADGTTSMVLVEI